ncbi:MAG: CPBP family intramembrane metalloprotease [Myxococcota bacterium]|nr:CPBP family intramembrane metalloprotease [Myxococcota bacterium]
MEPERRPSGPPLPGAPGGALPLLLGIALAGFVVAGFLTLGAVAERFRPGGMDDPVNLLLLTLIVFPLAVAFGLGVDRDGFVTLADGVTLRPVRAPTALLAVLFGIAAVVPLAEADNVMRRVFPPDPAEAQRMIDLLSFDGWGAQILKVVAVVVATPVGEEIVFRGIILRWLRRSYGRLAGITVSAFLFAGAHLSVRTFVPILLLGLFLAWVTDRSRSVIPAVAAHSVFNAFPFVIPPYAWEIPGWTPSAGGAVSHLPAGAVVGCSVACIVLLYAIWWTTLGRRDPPR